MFVIGVVVDGPVRPEARVDHVMGGLSEAVVCREKVAGAAPVQVKAKVLPLRVNDVIKMSGAKARLVIAWPKAPLVKTPANVVLPVVRSIVTNSRAK